MKPDDCIPEDELGGVLALPAGDPRRAHFDACPRCRALRASYEAFLAAEAGPEVYGPAERAALDAARERLLGAPAADPSANPAARPVVERRATPDPAAPWWAALFAPRRRPAWALAALAVVATVVVLLPRGDREVGSRVRGLSDRPLSLGEPVRDASGGVTLAWSGMAGAERYEVRFFSAALEPAGSVDAGAATRLALAADRLPPAFARGELVLWRVVAYQGGDELASSETRPLPAR